MARADVSTLKALVEGVLVDKAYNDVFDAIEVDEDLDHDGSDFLRIFLVRKVATRLTDDQLNVIASGIEQAVGTRDDRFASVFFPDMD